MQALTAYATPTKESREDGGKEYAGSGTQRDWAQLYQRSPHGNCTLFELEAMVAKRMEFLAWIDQLMNSPQAKSFDAVLDEIAARLPEERRSRKSTSRGGSTILGSDDAGLGSSRRSTSRGGAASGAASPSSAAMELVFEEDEDLLSHLLCRYAFCLSERWRKWLVKTEEVLLRARIKMEVAKSPMDFLVALMKQVGLPCEPLSAEERADPLVVEYLTYRQFKSHGMRESEGDVNQYYTVPMGLATRLVKTRSVLCRRGRAILFRDQVQEVFLTVFRGKLNRGLHDAYLARMKQQQFGSESEKSTVMRMLDAFLEHFIADPTDNLQEGVAGTVRAGDIQPLAQTHFPLCMRQIDVHLRREGHLKHHGRFTYGLFLKAIGLSLEDSMALFSTLMTQKGGGGSAEAFAKTAYGYNVRHNYGMEGKKTSYSSASCATIMGLPAVVDKNDCHGCPFRFRDEGAFRAMLQRDQKNPKGQGFPDVHPTAADIEDIVTDCKGQHYTRACYKYFMATHSGARRDTLFRSPFEYYTVSRETEVKTDGVTTSGASEQPSGRVIGTKGPSDEVTLAEDVVRHRPQL